MKTNTRNPLGMRGMIVLWIVSLFLLFGSGPLPSALTQAAAFSAASESSPETEAVELHIEGMSCRKCVKPLRKALLALPGVTAAEVSYSDAKAWVEIEKGRVSVQQLVVQAIEGKSNFFYTYKAKVISR